MNKKISVRHLSQTAWHDFYKDKFSWILLAILGVFFITIAIGVYLYAPEYNSITTIILSLFSAFYTAILHQNGLDAAYGRKLRMFNVSSSTLFASLFFIAISLYSPIPQYLEMLSFVLPADFYYVIAINWAIHAIISYILMRCMFVGMILLEEKLKVIDAFRKSFEMTHNHLFLLFGIFVYLNVALSLSAITIVGYFIVLPYTILMKCLLFKHLSENLKS